MGAFGQIFMGFSKLMFGLVLVGLLGVLGAEVSADRARERMPADIETRVENYLWAVTTNGVTAEVIDRRYGFYSRLRCPERQDASFWLKATRPVGDFLLCCDLRALDDEDHPHGKQDFLYCDIIAL